MGLSQSATCGEVTRQICHRILTPERGLSLLPRWSRSNFCLSFHFVAVRLNFFEKENFAYTYLPEMM